MVVENKALNYCKANVRLKTTPKYVKKQMKDFIAICEDKNKKYKINEKKMLQITSLLKLLKMPKGLKAGESLYDCSTGYQWLIYIATLCVVDRKDEEKRKYETVVLEIPRKNFKTYTASTLLLLLFLLEPNFSKFYSVAPDGAISKEVREALVETIKSSPLIYEYEGTTRFKVLRDYIMFKPTQSQYIPLSYSTSRMDSRLPNAFVADEVGALPINYPIQAMRSGQLNIKNKLGIIISTKYPTIDNPMEEEVGYCKKVLDGTIEDETRFALLYEPDKTDNWASDDLLLQQANPVALENKEIWEDLLKKRAYAIAVESARENFITKHCNIIYQGLGTESYVDVNDVQKCRVSKIDWEGRVVYLGMDLSETSDNTSITMLSVDEDNNILAKSFCFIPEDRIEEKTTIERVNYRELSEGEYCIACGGRVIDYNVVEQFVMNIETKYGVKVQAIGYDRWNALSTAQKLDQSGLITIEIKQHSSVLHPPTKLLKEKILSGEFKYEKGNPLYEINFQNSRCSYDTNKNMYVNKKKSNGKVDMVVSTINAMYLVQQDYLMNGMNDWSIQTV